jgi:hypothetical protein
MPALTTITILVYDLVKVNPTTRTLPAGRHQQHAQASLRKKTGKLLALSKKNPANN